MATVTLNFGNGRIASLTQPRYDAIIDKVTRSYKTSQGIDRSGLKMMMYVLKHPPSEGSVATDSPARANVFHLTMRLVAKLGFFNDVPGRAVLPTFQQLGDTRDRKVVRFKKFLLDIGKFHDDRERRMNSNMSNIETNEDFRLRFGPFQSFEDGTFRPTHPLRQKVVAILSRALQREPTDKDIDTFVYMFYGSDAFRIAEEEQGEVVGLANGRWTEMAFPLFRGLQNSDYDRNGRHYFRTGQYYGPRRSQRRIRRIRRTTGRRRYDYSRFSNSNNNSNSNRNNGNGNPSAQYARNKSRVDSNKAENRSYKNSIKWEEQTVNNLPSDPVTLNKFSNGQKAIKIHPTANHYVSPQTFRSMARGSMTDAFNKRGNAVLFKNPLTRQNVRRSNIKFVILKNRNTGRANAAKKNAANTIGNARRRQLTRRSTLQRAKAAMAALKRRNK